MFALNPPSVVCGRDQKFPHVGTDCDMTSKFSGELGLRLASSPLGNLNLISTGLSACVTPFCKEPSLQSIQPDGPSPHCSLQEVTSLPLLQHLTGQKKSFLCQTDVHCTRPFRSVAKYIRWVGMLRYATPEMVWNEMHSRTRPISQNCRRLCTE